MTIRSRILDSLWRLMRYINPRLLGRFRAGKPPSQMILLLTTTGRKTDRSRITPLQFEHVNGIYYVASARGVNADWYRNILVNPEVQVEIVGEQFTAKAEAITDPARIADFLEIRLERHPRMIKAMLRLEGMPPNFTRAELEKFSREKALVALHPYPTNNDV